MLLPLHVAIRMRYGTSADTYLKLSGMVYYTAGEITASTPCLTQIMRIAQTKDALHLGALYFYMVT